MKAFFDTSVYINTFFKKALSLAEFEKFFDIYEVVVCPVVRHELLLGSIHPHTRKALERFFDECPLLPAPSVKEWQSLTEVMQKLGWKENRQQNDVLIALTAREYQATVITFDRHFELIQKHLHFEYILLGP